MTESKTWNEATEGAAANGDGWGTTIDAEAQIVLEMEGEGFIGILDEIDPPNQNGIVQVHLSDVSDLTGQFLGENMFINGTRDLINKLKKVPLKSQIRCQWTSSMDTGQRTPMRVFSVQYR